MQRIILLCLLLWSQALLAQNIPNKPALHRLDSLYQVSAPAEEQLASALALQKDYAEQSDSNKAKLLFYIGNSYLDISKESEAGKYLEEALLLWKKLDKEHVLYAETLAMLALLYPYAQRNSEAEDYCKKALAMQERMLGRRDSSYARYLRYLGTIYNHTQRYEEAEIALLEALELLEQNKLQKHTDYAEVLFRLGVLYRNIGEYTRAETFYLRALALEQELAGEKSEKVLRNLYSLALLYDAQGELKKAESTQKKLLKFREELQGKQNTDYAGSLNALAITYSKQGSYQEALPLYQEVLLIYEALAMKESTYYSNTLNNLAITQELLGNYDEAERLYLQVLTAQRKRFGEKSLALSSICVNLISLYHKKADYQQADAYVRKALEAQSNLPIRLPLSQGLLDSLAEQEYQSFTTLLNVLENYFVSLAFRDLQKHKTTLQEISKLALRLLERSKNELRDERDKLFVLVRTSKWIELSLRFADTKEDAAEIFELLEKNKSVLLLEADANRKAYNSGLLPDSLLQREQELEKQYSQVRAQLAQASSQEQKPLLEQLGALDIKRLAFEKELKSNYPKYAVMRYQKSSISASDLQQRLEPNMAVLEYFLGDSATYICYIDKQRIEVKRLEIYRDEWQKRIKKFHQALSDYTMIQEQPEQAYQLYTEQAYWFYQQLLAPVLKEDSKIEQLLIVSDGELGHLPFESFLLEAAPTEPSDYKNLSYLIKKYTISYSYSASLWKENMEAEQKTNNGQLYGLAAEYKALSSELEQLRKPSEQRLRALLAPLPAARKEVEALERNFIGSFAFDEQASEKNFKAKASDYAVLHLAMHGLLNTKEPMLSSLAFTEDVDSTENNFLHAYEIATMELGAELVVLSACETGYGRFEKGNGIASLARSFMYASVPSLLVSLWQVNDYTTAYIMEQFYESLASGLPIDKALREAKLKYIAQAKGQAAHPAYWSPFVQIGKTNPIRLASKQGTTGLWLLALIAALILGFVAYWYMKRERT